MTTHWLAAGLNPQSPVFWILVNLISAVALAAFCYRSRSAWRHWLWPIQWVLIPYFGLLLGGLSPRLMGLAHQDWVATLGLGSGLLFVMLALLAVVRVTVGFADIHPSREQQSPPGENPGAESEESSGISIWQFTALVTILSGAQEFHWAFLRGGVWEALIRMPFPIELPAYWAVWAAAAIVILETALRRPSFEQWLFQLVLLAMTSILFLYTRNFWLCWILHDAAVMIIATNGHAQAVLLPGGTRSAAGKRTVSHS